jgi:hypothetical protein
MILRFPCGGIGRFNGLFDSVALSSSISRRLLVTVEGLCNRGSPLFLEVVLGIQ